MNSSEATNPQMRRLEPDEVGQILASERTLLAWTRTGLATMGLGFVLAQFSLFLQANHSEVPTTTAPSTIELDPRFSRFVGVVLITLGVFMHMGSGLRHYRFVRRIWRRKLPRLRAFSAAVVLSLILGVLGLAMAVYLLWLN